MSDLPKTLTFRDARRDDVPSIVRLLADDALGRSREAWGDAVDPAYLRAFDAISSDPNNRLIVADVDDEIAGCMQLTAIPHLTFKGGTRLQIEGVRVKDSFRGRQLGAAMIAWAIAWAEGEGCHLVQLTSNKARKDALRFYESQGFEPSHIGYKRYLT
ncbi:MAG: GNAT family N-acetyltransferase [Alphaproteobacteria bacterium]|nr:GNAT family N-acetyltransferase [Alphaproteobacteria bacterium]